jgi:signal transduction histidine kinase
MPRDLLFAAARPTRTGLIAWSLTRLPPLSPGASRGRLLIAIAGMTLVCLLLVLLTLDGWRMLHRGTRDLETALLRLRGDLRAEIPIPRATELARVAAGLHAMASELADTRTREHELERRLDHEQRLAGLGRVVAGVAHEVRNPITGIKLKLDGLMRRDLDERARADISTCLEEIARLDRVVSSLLMVARTAPTDKQSLALEQLVDARIHHAQGLGAERGIRLRRIGSAHVDGNREALTAVIDNLLRNAVEASPAGGEVEVVLTSEDRARRIEVCDRGDGIPPARIGELFEPFFTLKPTGTGLGLFLCRSLLTAQGATLAYRRDEGRTIFTVELP